MKLVRLIWSALGEKRRNFITAILAAFGEGLAQAAVPAAIGLGLARLSQGDASVWAIAPYAAAIVLAVGLRIVLMRVSWRQGFDAGTKATETVRNRVVDHMGALPLGLYQRWGAAKLAALLTEDARWINETGSSTLKRTAGGIATAVALTLVIAICAPLAGWTVAAAAVAGFVALRLIARILPRMIANRNAIVTELIQRVGEYAEGIAVFRSFNQGGAALAKFDTAIEQLRRLMVREAPQVVFLGHIGIIIIALGPPLALVILGATQTPLAAPLYLAPALLLTLAVRNALLVEVVHGLPILALGEKGEANVSAFLSEPAMSGDETAFAPRPGVQFKNVTFGYAADKPAALTDISFTARAGEVTAIVGPSGAGKSTIASLIMRFFDVNEGQVLVGGQDLRRADPQRLQSLISLVNQDVHLFRDTLRANLLLGDPSADARRLAGIIEATQLQDLVNALPDGLDTMLGDTGRTLSGGERQRVAVARALLKNAPIILLDEATSAMDPLTERAIQRAFAALERGRTLIVIAHRLRTIAAADQILVVDGGRIVQRGKHKSLLAQDGVYRRLWDAQSRAAGWRLRA